MIKKILSTDLKRDLVISVGGTALAQMLHFGTTPILSRLYSPENFGQLTLFLSFLAIFNTMSLLKLDLALMSADKSDTNILEKIIYKVSFVISIVSLFLLIGSQFTTDPKSPVFFLLPFALLVSARYWTSRAIINKEGGFKTLSLGKVFENISNSGTAILIGLTAFKDYGLIIGKLIGLTFTSYYYSKNTPTNDQALNRKLVKDVLKKYIKFPTVSFPSSLIGQLNYNLTVFLFVYFFTVNEVGFLGLTVRVLDLPANFVSISFFDVFKRKAVEDYKQHGYFDHIFLKFFYTLSILALILITFIFFFGEDIFSFAFGEKWREAGTYAKYLVIFYAVKLIAVPLTYSFEVTNKNEVNLIFQIIFLLAGLLSIGLTYFISKNDLMCIIVYSISMSSFYLLHILFAYFNSRKQKVRA